MKKELMRRFANFLNSKLWDVGKFEIHVNSNTYNGSIEDIQKLKKIIHNFILNRENEYAFNIFLIHDEDEFESSGITYYMLNAEVYMSCFDLKKYYQLFDFLEKYRKNHLIFISNIAWH